LQCTHKTACIDRALDSPSILEKNRWTDTEMEISVNGKNLILLTETKTEMKNYEKRKRNGKKQWKTKLKL